MIDPSSAAQGRKQPVVPTELCEARYATGEFAGITCIEQAVEARYDLGLCKRHAKVWDRWLKYGYDYARSMARYEWQVEIHA